MGAALPHLKRRAEFLRAARSGLKSVTPGLILQARRRHGRERFAFEGDSARVGFTVSKKVGNAVIRNRARRRLRAAAEQILADHALAGHDYVIIGRAATPERPFGKLLEDLTKSLKRLKLYKEGDSAPGESS
ncbi:ribonuclease P protein component [Magnetospira sp. QH-2]|uniref:ribonuclease P protein component n=1 Tax=Magnetospira sp. (strain QH-2) TaxID=1288970 RepID=UPI0003E81268|nr:ribonuclease P protein component [Magnetospira sp. QH-2]CCQ72113.1 Ribonuclease P protein component [Magnetospira sp. QH-2]